MQRIVATAVMALAALAGAPSRAQDVEPPEVKPERHRLRPERHPAEGGRRWAGPDQGALIMRLLFSPKLLAEADISAEQAEKLRAALKELELKRIDLDAGIRKMSLAQTEQMSKLLADTQSAPQELMATVEKIGGLRTEQAKLQVQRLIVIREHLTPDQIARIRELALKQAAQYRDQEGQRGEMGGRGPRERARGGERIGREGQNPARPPRPEGWGD